MDELRRRADAQYTLGGYYRDGTGVPQDYSKAFELLSKAADAGNADAMVSFGQLYANGKMLPLN